MDSVGVEQKTRLHTNPYGDIRRSRIDRVIHIQPTFDTTPVTVTNNDNLHKDLILVTIKGRASVGLHHAQHRYIVVLNYCRPLSIN